jgi:serine-type D-Ala-D-Ala endopeptidase (penicillin-binding protein 7)
MKRFLHKNLLITTLAIFLNIFSPLVADAAKLKSAGQPAGPIVLVKDGSHIVTQTDAEIKWPLASISKLMTALVLNDLDLDWNKSIVQSKEDELGGARLRVAVNSKYRRIDLLHASLIGSANNSTHALARTSGIPMDEFVARMNEKAHYLGMTGTHFVEVTGLSPENISTASDIARLIEAAQKVPRIVEIGNKQSYTLRSIGKKPREHTIISTNKLLRSGNDVGLGKTGFIDESGYNFTVVGQNPAGGSRTVVVLNAPSSAVSFKLARAYIDLEN